MQNTTIGVTLAANMDPSGVLNGVKAMQGAFNGLKLPANLTRDITQEFDKLTKNAAEYKKLMEKGINTKSDFKAFEKLEKSIGTSIDKIVGSFNELNGKQIYLDVDATKIRETEQEINKLKADITNKLSNLKIDIGGPNGKISTSFDSLFSGIDKAISRSSTLKDMMASFRENLQIGNLNGAISQLDQLEKHAITLKGSSANLLESFKQIGLISFSTPAKDLAQTKQGADLLKQGFDKIRASVAGASPEIKTLVNNLETLISKKTQLEEQGRVNYQNTLSKGAQDAQRYATEINKAAQANNQFVSSSLSATQQVQQLQQSTQYFFSLRNMINLLKRGIDEAVQSVKELDAAMTETAVVTDYKVSDLWGMLPQYTQLANQLGATTQGAYETMTLYFQQGLDQQAAFEIGAETMKMARIAGLDYAETTDMMTAALRGFNMELNETSAKRVNDVYSELAAITASDTEELGTAMQRTASIAHSAGMSFEGTTAFLAQAIETTREPAENIGTAMKTIVARFQEMKKNPLEISDVEGEEVSYNKIDTALKSIGVNLKDTNGQFRELDQVFLDISQRWDGLTQTQQRYIATTAAGSRQQSRFIAMMSNYGRTVQLMDAANNSAGASDEQFSKTMDSLESKLNKLHNAWQQFTMGIANNSIIKTAVDGLTGFLNITNQIIDTLSLGSGTIKSFLSVFAAFTGLKMSGKLLNSLIGGLGGLIDPTSSFTQGLFGGATGIRSTRSAYNAAQIYKPIVDAINNQTNQLKPGANAGANVNNPLNTSVGYKDYINARNNYRTQAKEGGTIGGAIDAIGQLSSEQRQMVLLGNRGSQATLRRSLLAGLQGKGFSKASQKLGGLLYDNVMQGFADGKLTTKQAQEALHSRDLIKATRAAGPEAGKAYADAIKTELANNEAAIYDQAAHYMETKGLDYKQALQLSKKEHIANWRNRLNTEDFTSASTQAATKSEKLMNTMSGLGNTVMTTGQAFTTLGSILSNLGLDTVGMLFTTLGSTISSVGMTISSVGSMLSTFGIKVAGVKGTFTALKAAIADAGLMPLLGGLGAGLLVGGAFAVIKTLVKKSEEKAKESAKKIQDTYTEATEETEKKINSLNDSKTRFEQLSKGVDKYGRNVSLTNEDYKEFLDLSRSIADVAPELISGYDAEGHAIIAQGDAIDQLIAKQKELKKQAQENYTTNTAFKDVIKGIYVSDAYKNVKSSGYSAQVHGLNTFDSEITGIRDALFKVGYNDMTAVNNALSKYLGRDIDLSNVTTEDIRAISEHYGDLIKAIESNNHNLSDSAKESLEQALSGLNESWDDLVSETAPLIDQLQQYLNLNKLDAIGLEIGDEFIVGFNKGLENIALDAVLKGETDVGKIKNAAKEYAQLFKDNVGPGSKFAKVLDDLDKAQTEYLNHLGETEAINNYKEATESASDSIKELAESMRDGSAAGEAMYNVLINKANEIRNSINEPIMSIGEAINTLSDDIDEARGAYDEFSKLTKDKNYSTAAEGMKKIYDEAMDAKHSGYDGDFTFWEGSRRLLDPKTAQGDVDTVRSAMESLAPLLEEGIAGYEAFYNRVTSLSQETRDNLTSQYGILFDEDGFLKYIPDTKEAWGALGKEFKMSEMMLTSMLNKAQQFADIDFSNVPALKQALSEDERVYHAAGGKQVVKQDLLVDEIRQQYPDWNDTKVYDFINNLGKEIITIPSKLAAEERGLTEKEVTKSLTSAGIKNMDDVLQKLGPTGVYNEDDLKYYAGLVDKDGVKDWDTAYKDFKNSLSEPIIETNSILQQIAGDVATLAGKKTQDHLKEGKATSKDFKKVDKMIDDVYGETGVNDTPFQKFMLGQDENGKLLSKNQYIDTRQAIQDAQDAAKETQKAAMKGYYKAKVDGDDVQAEALLTRAKKLNKLILDLDTITEKGDKAFKKSEKQKKQTEEDSNKEEGTKKFSEKKTNKKSSYKKEKAETVLDSGEPLGGWTSKSNKPFPGAMVYGAFAKTQNKSTTLDMTSGLGALGKTIFTSSNLISALNKIGTSPLLNLTTSALSNIFPKEYPVGNTDLNNRQVLDWSKEPKNSQNYKNAADWGYSSQDLQNQVSTYLSSAFTDSDKLGEYGIAFTPMLQGENGTPQVLSGATVRSYFDQIISEATTNGALDFNKLMQLDHQGVETEAGKIHDLIMGTFRGEGQGLIDTTNVFGDVTHIMSDLITQGYGQAIQGLDPVAIAQNAEAYDALRNVYQSVLEGTLPSQEDLAILQSTDLTGAQSQVNLQLQALSMMFANAQEAIMSMDSLTPEQQSAALEITSKIQEWLNNTLESGVAGVTTPSPSNLSPTIQHDQEAGMARTEQLKVETDDSELDKTKEKTDEVKSAIEEGAKLTITVPGSEKVGKVAREIQKINNAQSNKDINVTAHASGTDEVNQLISTGLKAQQQLHNHSVDYSADVSGTADTEAGVSAGEDFEALTDHTVYYTTVYKTIGSPGRKDAAGEHNHGYASMPTFGSAAGGYGQVGPKGKGGLTLTGELGYEIAWLPSENRSVILGANGPQMINLPGNAVVWTHEQSKKILKQQSIPAGSARGSVNVSGATKYLNVSSGSSGRSSGSSGGGNGGSGSQAVEKVAEKASETVDKIGRVTVWWENIARRTEVWQRRADKNQKAYEKYLKKLQATLTTTGTIGQANDYIKNLNQVIKLNQDQIKKANDEINELNSPKFKETYISYSVKGDDDKSENKEENISLAPYLTWDNGVWTVDQAALDKISSKEKRKAVADAANKELNDRLSKRNKAEDEVIKTQEAIEKLADELYEAFFDWETELNKIWNITKQIESTEKNISRSKQYSELFDAQLASGMQKATADFAKTINKAFSTEITQQVKEIKARSQAIALDKEEIKNLLSTADETAQLKTVQNKLNTSTAIQNAYNDVKAKADKVNKGRAQVTNPKTTSIGDLEYGQKNNSVKRLQQALNKIMGSNLNTDGYFGSETLAVVKEFQRKYKNYSDPQILADGIVGSATKQALSKFGYNFYTETTKGQSNISTLNADIKAYEAAAKRYEEIKNSGRILSDTETLAYQKQAEQLSQQIAAIDKARSFMTTTEYADGTVDVVFNTDAFEQAKQEGNITSDMAKKIEEYVNKIVDASQKLKEDYESLTSDLAELYKTLDGLKDQWAEYSTQLLDITEKQESKRLDMLKKLGDAITNALKNLFEEVKRKLTERRQQEDNAKTERDIAQKQQRLAALRADTSGGHQVEIAQLEKEISDAQQGYQRTLEDQLLDKLQQQADKAAEQRERQIELQEAILDATNNAALVNLWMSDPVRYRSEIEEAYRTANDYTNQPLAQQDKIDRDFEVLFSGLQTNQTQQQTVEQAIRETNSQLTLIKSVLDQIGNVSKTTPSKPTITPAGTAAPATPKANTTAAKTTTKKAATASSLKVSSISGDLRYGQRNNNIKTLQTVLNKLGFRGSNGKALDVDGYFGSNTLYAVQQFQRKYKSKYGIAVDGVVGPATKRAFKGLGYKTGGLADYTGPAWLDGTPGKPELVLNATDTKNFLALRDVLSNVMSSVGSVGNTSYGDMSYQININVDHINSDYDVDKIAERVKKNIVKDASYRNVTQIRSFR